MRFDADAADAEGGGRSANDAPEPHIDARPPPPRPAVGGKRSRRAMSGGGGDDGGGDEALAPAPAAAAGEVAPAARHVARAAAAAYRELGERRARLAQLEKVLATMELERQLQGKGSRKLVAAATPSAPAVYKWKAQRKR